MGGGGILIALSEDYHRSGLVFIEGKRKYLEN